NTPGGTEPGQFLDKTYTVPGTNVTFTMKAIQEVNGGTLGDVSQSENKVHTVNLKAYRIGETEVTQELWEAAGMTNNSTDKKSPQNPVETLTWIEAAEFCNKLTEKVMGAKEKVYTISGSTVTINSAKKGFRLLNEAEWEWAARGGQGSKWAGTDEEAKLEQYAWYTKNAGDKVHTVKTTVKANGFGLYDMSGNVFEWCWDWYEAITKPDLLIDPIGPASGSTRVYRGGCFGVGADRCETSKRDNGNPINNKDKYLGLRIATNAE
ncbi:formylglycine-generating enzyme family protein, partial [Treponema pedis]|uniref:formylglycine-generating enzyme family protein n=1 Tax=Treponema pedis TaxID=409322 RepID=UPI0004944EE1